MITALWAVALALAVLWPGRLAGPLDGAPLDTASEAVLIGLGLPFLLWSNPRLLRHRACRAVVVLLLAWKAVTAATLEQDGWCLRFTSPVPLYRDMGQVPHAWDVRADWRTPEPQCSAIMTRGYDRLDSFPAWFYNLPPVAPGQPANDSDRPPLVTLRIDLHGFLDAPTEGTLRLESGRDVTARISVDGAPVKTDDTGVAIGPGLHSIAIEADLTRDDWKLMPTWNGRNLWSASIATVAPPSTLDGWLRPWGRFVPAIAIAALLLIAASVVARRANSGRALGLASALAVVLATIAWSGRPSLIRAAPLLLLAPALVTLPHRLRNMFGASLLIGLPFLAMVAVMGAPQAGRFTLYTSGDDWWLFQRFAYRIFMQGYWLEGGQLTFWYQPLYRWIAGTLHMVFGDSSVGELFWDAACVLTGAVFAFHLTRVTAGFRWGVAASAIVLAMFTLGPPWYLIGRGLSEISSMGFISAAALLAMRGRHGSWHIVLAAVLTTLAFFTRLNNLPMVIAIAAFAWPLRQPIADLYRPKMLIANASTRSALVGVLWGTAIGLWLFTARTWYYTGVPSMLFGTQADALSAFKATDEGLTAFENVVGSVLMVLTMNDPPRLDVRALPLMAGMLSAILGLVGVRPFNRLPLGAVALCLAGISGALVARGSAYPGRFSVHLIPVAVALFVSAVALVSRRKAEVAATR